MSPVQQILSLSLVTLMASAGCRSSDPLSGTWSNDTCFGSETTPADIESCEVALTFTDALEISLDADWVSKPATAHYPGCITKMNVSGQTWSTKADGNEDILHVEGNGRSTVERVDCVNEGDEMEPTSTDEIWIPSGDISYQISDNVLTILDSNLVGTYER